MVLLKSEGYTAKDIAVILGSNTASVYNWLTRYDAAGIAGLTHPVGARQKTGIGRRTYKHSKSGSGYHKPVRLLKKAQAKG